MRPPMTDSAPLAAATPVPLPRAAPPGAARCHVLIPCAGQGSRAGTAQPKQYQPVAGRPLVRHTLAAFAAVPRIDRGLLVVAPDDPHWNTAAPPIAPFSIARCGGSTRAESVLNGLGVLLAGGADAHDWVLVHDAARCLVTPTEVNALIDACLPDAVGGLLALPLPDTLKAARQERVAATVARDDKWLAQTPQMFRLGLLRQALQQAAERARRDPAADPVTDESSAIEALGLAPRLVPGSAQNFKVTYPNDFALADAILRSRMP